MLCHRQCLDQGADGIIVPYINNATEAREAVSAAKYPTAVRTTESPLSCSPAMSLSERL
jgi:4-hydroxy-2-oxoheptanedioate aldolase|eukprot:COSAG06_NODE_571_length_14101_cov_12.481682_13_plen_59_part_00